MVQEAPSGVFLGSGGWPSCGHRFLCSDNTLAPESCPGCGFHPVFWRWCSPSLFGNFSLTHVAPLVPESPGPTLPRTEESRLGPSQSNPSISAQTLVTDQWRARDPGGSLLGTFCASREQRLPPVSGVAELTEGSSSKERYQKAPEECEVERWTGALKLLSLYIKPGLKPETVSDFPCGRSHKFSLFCLSYIELVFFHLQSNRPVCLPKPRPQALRIFTGPI